MSTLKSNKILINFDFNPRNSDRILKKLAEYEIYPIYIVCNDKYINAHSILGLLSLDFQKGSEIEILADSPDYIFNKILNVFNEI